MLTLLKLDLAPRDTANVVNFDSAHIGALFLCTRIPSIRLVFIVPVLGDLQRLEVAT